MHAPALVRQRAAPPASCVGMLIEMLMGVTLPPLCVCAGARLADAQRATELERVSAEGRVAAARAEAEALFQQKVGGPLARLAHPARPHGGAATSSSSMPCPARARCVPLCAMSAPVP